MSKSKVYLIGFITLLGFPAVGMAAWYFVEQKNPFLLLEWKAVFDLSSVYGLLFGATYALFALWLFKSALFKREFLSVCAGFGEEILFRACIQYWIGPWVTAVLFVAIHGYLNPKNRSLFVYGLALVPFVLVLSFGYIEFGLWFSITAHFSYDLVLLFYYKKMK